MRWMIIGMLWVSFLGSYELKAAGSSSQQIKLCRQVVAQLSPFLGDLLPHLTTPTSEKQWFSWTQLAGAGYSTCSHPQKLGPVLETARKIYRHHQGGVGLLLPAYSPGTAPAILYEEFNKGWRAACKALGCSRDQPILVRKVLPGSIASLQAAVSELTLHKQVAVLIGGWDIMSARFLNEAAQSLKTPVFLIKPFPIGKASPYTFHLFPHEKILAERLLSLWQKKHVRSLAILQPSTHSADLINAVRLSAPHYKINRVEVFPYESSQYESMESAVKKLLKLNSGSGRGEEWKGLMLEAKKTAELEGVAFDERNIFLSPKMNFDMVLIPDNAKVLRHFLKIFQYLRFKGTLPLSGTPLWRSEEVVRPWEKMIEGAFFVDFVGPYHELPPVLRSEWARGDVSGPHQGIFIDPRRMAPIDLKLIGYRVMSVALQMRYFADQKRKTNLAHQFRDLYYRDDFFKNPQVFHKNYTHWPTFVFQLSSGRVHHMVSSHTQKLLTP